MDVKGTKYEIELWGNTGVRLADISKLATNRQFTQERNEAETLTFELDLDDFQRYCQDKLNTDPKSLLWPHKIDAKLKRYGQYLFGTRIESVRGSLAADGNKLSVQCSGYLNLFRDRYVSKAYIQTERTALATGLISEAQARVNGSMGVTIASGQYTTGLLSDRTYNRANVKSSLQNLTTLRDGMFDFTFSPAKEFRTYSRVGANRSDIKLIYPGEHVVSMDIDRDGTAIFNTLTGLGSGFGDDQIISEQADVTSQLEYLMSEKIPLFNSVVLKETLDQNTLAVLNRVKDILEIPQLILTGKSFEDIPMLSVGDTVWVQVNNNLFYNNIHGFYRVERIEVDIDENDFENSIKVYFDNMDVAEDTTEG